MLHPAVTAARASIAGRYLASDEDELEADEAISKSRFKPLNASIPPLFVAFQIQQKILHHLTDQVALLITHV